MQRIKPFIEAYVYLLAEAIHTDPTLEQLYLPLQGKRLVFEVRSFPETPIGIFCAEAPQLRWKDFMQPDVWVSAETSAYAQAVQSVFSDTALNMQAFQVDGELQVLEQWLKLCEAFPLPISYLLERYFGKKVALALYRPVRMMQKTVSISQHLGKRFCAKKLARFEQIFTACKSRVYKTDGWQE